MKGAEMKVECQEVEQRCGQSETVCAKTDEQRQTDNRTPFTRQATAGEDCNHSEHFDLKINQNSHKQVAEMCNVQLQSVDILKSHQTTQSSQCAFCNNVFEESKDLKSHLKSHSKDRCGCVHCPMKVNSQGNLIEHLICHKIQETPNEHNFGILKSLLAYSDTDLKASLTGFDANSILKSYLESNLPHVKREGDPIRKGASGDDSEHEPNVKRYFQCKKCPRKFQLLKKLRLHQQIHALGTATFKCRKCSREFQREKALEKHKSKHNMPKFRDRVYQCDLCPRTFALERSMKAHRNVHFGSKEFECRLCGKKFNEQATLNTHAKCFHFIQPHVDAQNASESLEFKCQQCDNYFANSDDFRSHVDTCNSDERVKKRQYACNLCGRIIDSKRSLEDHKRTHVSADDRTRQADGTYKCTQCVKVFKWKNTYKRHVLEYHPTPVTFSCMRCKVALSSLAELTVHLATHGLDIQAANEV